MDAEGAKKFDFIKLFKRSGKRTGAGDIRLALTQGNWVNFSFY
ncbi:hypothetical protein HMPREF9996_02301 [Aggregatibacter actinomycetemcomitans Y4]|nr:hypothetical protein HMPREF9996_02301 [Aggregatibacter actinomycetemcomitans Y4]KYK76055.1 hypothetical protein SA2876_07000 [Aggregatibacter actinomycetemcomitans serotype e str. SA2876]KYK87277.1 hypothetical protein SA2200_05920 [Aggregatibacter actinomycetemcomitans serotype d str. SA2200]KYK87738.1 hypothetical protein SC29R_05615 [Aggregatibacter actinomycetemcomitans serotype f str. SC29R]KYK91106.1 hypothetical protein SA508_01410 [Aggregatibacter actinomycetemcomitans serotype d str